ncbi:OmpA family protein [Bacteroides stercorirosoris]|uniref:OmpA family protein n=1 Tax=Bacteroides stercorirosoris TaxID=871324 RepID=A0A1M6F9K9_9BACE|nr:OmpA family protein [Bacteroides stercorirosoris]RGX79831.1 OmpA family protein [Bacteroides stercorirosoris]SHI94418.1 OmpA family protein [Bacteroides stercorirosoris]
MKKILMLLALAGLTSAAWAQNSTSEVVEYEVIQVQDKYQVITNPFWSNWFFSIGGGAEATFGDNDKAGSFGKRISPTLNVSVGKWFTPGLGLRLQYSGLQARGFTYDAGADYVKGTQLKDGYYKQRFDYMNLHGDVMFNLNALFGGYNQHRVYEIIPYVGAGFTHNYSKPHREALSVNAGIINKFRISNAIDINLELSAMGVEDKFDGEVGGDHGYDGVLSATVGLTYRFPARGFRRPMPQLISQIELAAMQDKLAMMGAQNAQLKNALVQAENQPVAEVTETEVIVPDPDIAPRTVFFTIGSAELSPREIMNLSYLAEQMKQFPNATYTVNGYADSATGTPAFNKELSLKRAQAVKNALVKNYGIAADRLNIEAGGGVDKFGQPILNRVVLVKSAN